jgi:subtilisin family serine protease
MWTSNFGLHRLPLAAFALACGSTFGAPVDPDLAAAARRDGRAEALIVLADQATPATRRTPAGDYKAHRRALVDALRTRADTSQAGLRAWLDARGVDYRPYWIANMVYARLSADELVALAARPEIGRIASNPTIRLALPKASPARAPATPDSPDTIAWGVSKINAPQVWAAGFTGQGVVIAGEDTGYQWDHPALEPQYRGWNGSSADHNYNWHDAIHVPNGKCPADSKQPCDDFGHGTHTAGTFAGDDHDTHQVGVAPGAKWIGCRNMNAGNGTPASYIECMQFMLAPTDLKGRNPNPDLAPDVVSNSWECPASEGCTVGNELIQAETKLTKAGILFVAAAANAGPSCSTITNPPGIYSGTFTIGATDVNDVLAGFSSRGPVLKAPHVSSDQVKPDVSAPGVNVYSTWPPNTYANLSGTSMATPHVAGAAALLMSAVPKLKGHPVAVIQLLRDTAATSGVTDPVDQACGGTSRTTWPNNMLGFGRIDVYAAYLAAIAKSRDIQDEL